MFKKGTLKGFVLGVAVATILTASFSTLAETVTKQIPVSYNGIKIMINGTQLEPKDAKGTAVTPFVYNGTVFLPARAIAEALGKYVAYDSNTVTVSITDEAPPSVAPAATPAPGAAPAGSGAPAAGTGGEAKSGSGKVISGKGGTTWADYQAYLTVLVKASEAIVSNGGEKAVNEFLAGIAAAKDQKGLGAFPCDMLFSGMLDFKAMTYDEFVAAGGTYNQQMGGYTVDGAAQ